MRVQQRQGLGPPGGPTPAAAGCVRVQPSQFMEHAPTAAPHSSHSPRGKLRPRAGEGLAQDCMTL